MGFFVVNALYLLLCVLSFPALSLSTDVRSLLSAVCWLLFAVVKFLTRCLREGCS